MNYFAAFAIMMAMGSMNAYAHQYGVRHGNPHMNGGARVEVHMDGHHAGPHHIDHRAIERQRMLEQQRRLEAQRRLEEQRRIAAHHQPVPHHHSEAHRVVNNVAAGMAVGAAVGAFVSAIAR